MSIRSMLLKANHTVQVLSKVATATALGGTAATKWNVIGTINPCWVQPASASTRLKYERRDMFVTHSIYCDKDPQVTIDNRLTFNGRQMSVKGVHNEGELNRFWVIDALE